MIQPKQELEQWSQDIQQIVFDDGGGQGLDFSIDLGVTSSSQSQDIYSFDPHYFSDHRSSLADLLVCDDSIKSSQLVCSGQLNPCLSSGVKISQKSKCIKKGRKPKTSKTVIRKPRKRKPRPNRPLPKRIRDRLDAGWAPFSQAFKCKNPKKNTPKRVSIFFRMKLKKRGFDLKRIEGEKNRVRPVYLHQCLQYISYLQSESEFHKSMQDYRAWLKSEWEWEQYLYDTYGDETSQSYVQVLKLASQCSILFEDKRLLESLKLFLGNGKEELYRGQNIILFIEAVRWVFNQKKNPFPIPELQELNQINQRSLCSLEKVMQKVENLQAKENFIDSCLNIG